MKRPARVEQPQACEKYITTSFGAISVAIIAGIEAMCVGIWAVTWL